MNYLGITYSLKNQPLLDKNFIPFGVWAKAYLKEAARPFKIAVERENGLVSVFETKLRGAEFAEANARFVERFVKMLLWSVGGWKVSLCGDDAIAKRMQNEYRAGGKREFDVGFMQDVYERPFEIVISDEEHFPAAHEQTRKAGGHTNGCRIGFDAGGSDRKVSAVVDGETVYSEEVVWHPKTSEDPQYQYDGIVAAFKTAASKMPRVDGIGVSSAGVFIGNAPMVSSIFLKVPRSRREEVKTIFDRAAKELGDVPIVVANDGDVSALAGSMSLGAGCVMGLAMGTSEAVGYVNRESNLLGWISELAFAPSCEGLARQVQISVSKLSMGFSMIYGISVHAYVIEQRLERAAGLLLESNMNIGQIAVLVGYTKPSNFSAAFKKKYGVMPKDYREASRIK